MYIYNVHTLVVGLLIVNLNNNRFMKYIQTLESEKLQLRINKLRHL